MNFDFPNLFRSVSSPGGAASESHPAISQDSSAQNFHTPIQTTLAFFLDQLIRSNADAPYRSGPIQGGLHSGRVSYLSESFSLILSNQKAQIRDQLGNAGLAFIFSLAEESDPQIFYRDLIHFGEQCLIENRPQIAALIFQILNRTSGEDGGLFQMPPIPVGIRQRALENLEVLSGEGPLARRLEVQSNRFIQGATSPSMILGMAVGSTVFTSVRSLILPRLLASRGSGLIATGFGVRLTASSLALIPEVGAFWITSKGIEEYLRPGSQNWDIDSDLRELAGLTLTLGLLKSTGFVFGRGHQWARQLNQSGRAGAMAQAFAGGSLPLWHQTGMLGGIVLARGMETYLGWRPPQSFGAFFTDSLITLAQFNIGGRISQAFFPHLYHFNARLNGRMEISETGQLKGLAEVFRGSSGFFNDWRVEPFFHLRPVLANSRGDIFKSNSSFPRDPKSQHLLFSERLPNSNDGISGEEPSQNPLVTQPGVDPATPWPESSAHRMAEQIREFENLFLEQTDPDALNLPKQPLEIKPLPQGDLQITLTVPKTRPSNPEDPRFDEVYQEIDPYLQNLGWGPLFVKAHAGRVHQLRFDIPGESVDPLSQAAIGARINAFLNAVTIWGTGPETNMEQNFREGFYVPQTVLNRAIPRILYELPGGPSLFDDFYGAIRLEKHFESGTLTYRRMELLHRVLVGKGNLENVRVTENGPGGIIDTAATLARMGSRVKIKEPDEFMSTFHRDRMKDHFPEQLREKIEYVPTAAHSPSDIVYWANPGPANIVRFNKFGSGDYIGRDLEIGGLAVVQTDNHLGTEESPHYISFNPLRWERVFEDLIPPQWVGVNYVFPTAQNTRLYLQIYRKLAHQ